MRDTYDVIILGCGVAGLYAALNFSSDTKILLCTKAQDPKLSNSSLAQGGVAAVLDLTQDDFTSHVEDTMIAGGFENDPEAVKTLVEEGPDDVRRLFELGVDFDREPDGTPQKTLEGGHSKRRIVHHKDSTGAEIVNTLYKTVRALANVDFADDTICMSLSRTEKGFFAELIKNGGIKWVSGSFVILATGGVGRVYKYTTNSAIATGDGIRLAYEMGAEIKQLHYIQFHPTAFAATDGRERFLISEAVRGEGAYLLNCKLERFMHLYDERLELAPRDKVSHSIMMEYRRTGSDDFYLDITRKDSTVLKERFPMIYARCLEEGVDITKDPIPVFPCQHYLMGGIRVDLLAYTGIPRLYAIGECANTGVHGKNRLASNSLLEALVFSRRAAADIEAHMARPAYRSVTGAPPPVRNGKAPLPEGMRTQIREIMQNSHFVLPDREAAQKGLKQVRRIRDRLTSDIFEKTPDFCEAKSLAVVAELILKGATGE